VADNRVATPSFGLDSTDRRSTGPATTPMSNTLTGLPPATDTGHRRTGGRVGGHLPGWPQARVLLLDHTGARSRVRRTSPLIYHREGDVVAVAASKGGQPTYPAWFHNLKVNPDTTIQVGTAVHSVHARVATDEERDRLWPRFTAFFPSYDFYRRNAKGRRIPIVILEPR
jgi:F420H(2)-dependent quinone reductase